MLALTTAVGGVLALTAIVGAVVGAGPNELTRTVISAERFCASQATSGFRSTEGVAASTGSCVWRLRSIVCAFGLIVCAFNSAAFKPAAPSRLGVDGMPGVGFSPNKAITADSSNPCARAKADKLPVSAWSLFAVMTSSSSPRVSDFRAEGSGAVSAATLCRSCVGSRSRISPANLLPLCVLWVLCCTVSLLTTWFSA